MTQQQCLTCTRRNIPPEQVSCPACGSVDLRGYDAAAQVQMDEAMHEIDERSKRP